MGTKILAHALSMDNRESFLREQKANEEKFKEILKKMRPDLFVLMDMLDSTGVNPLILWKVLRQLNNIAIGNRWGQITITIENGVVTFVRGEEADKLNEQILKKSR